jgi:hypothetical protein
VLGQTALKPAPGMASAGRRNITRDLVLLAAIAAVTLAYVYLLATNTVDGLRGNEQWHLPRVANPPNDRWWLPLVPGVVIAVLPLLSWPAGATITAGMVAGGAFAYALFAAQWGGGDNLLAKIINEPTAFHRAASQITDLGAVLASYPQYMLQFEPSSHLRSHAPGDLLLFRWLNDLMQASPSLGDATLNWARTFIGGTDMLLRAGNQPYLLAGAVAAIPLIIGLGRLAAVPLAWLSWLLKAPAVPAALLFLVLPTTLVHLPLLDTVYPLLTALVLFAGVLAIERRSWALALLTGALWGVALFYSGLSGLAAIPLAVYGLLRGGWRTIVLGLPAAAGAGAFWLILWLGWRINMPAILHFQIEHQRDFEAQRTYWLWFRWKWYDFVMFCGIPVAALCVKFLVESVGRWRTGAPLRIDLFFAGWLALMVFLWLTPAALAEGGRLWAPLMCFSVIFAAYALPRLRPALPLILLLQIAQIMTINRYLEVINSG